jgi:hypothetical protein
MYRRGSCRAGGGSGGDVASHLGGTRTALYVTTGRPPWAAYLSRQVCFSKFAALLEEQISEKISRRMLSGDQGMIVWRRTPVRAV